MKLHTPALPLSPCHSYTKIRAKYITRKVTTTPTPTPTYCGTVVPWSCCLQVYHQGLYGKSYVWILSGTNLHTGWLDSKWAPGCTQEQLEAAAEGHFTLNLVYESSSENKTISGKVPQTFINISNA